MPVTRADIMEELEDLLSDEITVPDPDPGNLEPDPNTGVVTYPTITRTKFEIVVQGNTKDLVEALIDAILIRIDEDGLEMGDSLATKMEVE